MLITPPMKYLVYKLGSNCGGGCGGKIVEQGTHAPKSKRELKKLFISNRPSTSLPLVAPLRALLCYELSVFVFTCLGMEML